MPPAAYRYLTTLVSAAQGLQLGERDKRELQTLAICCDHLAKGNTAGLGDVLMQRFKAVESSVNHKSWDYSKHLELVPNQHFQATSMKEQEQAAKLVVRESQLQGALRKRGEFNEHPKGQR